MMKKLLRVGRPHSPRTRGIRRFFGALQMSIFFVRAVTFVDGVVQAIFLKFCPRGIAEVDSGFFGDQDKVDQNVGAFVTKRFAFFGVGGQGGDFIVAFPLGQLKQLRRFEVERNDQVSQGVVLAPVPFIAKPERGLFDFIQRHGREIRKRNAL